MLLHHQSAVKIQGCCKN